MKRLRPFRQIVLPVLFWIAAAGVASAQFDFRGMIDGAMDQVQGAVNGAIDRIRGSDEDGSGDDAYAPEDGAPQPIAGQDNAFSLDFGGDAASATTASPSPTQGGETVSVLGRGMGINREEALKDAYRDAIERAVGLYVDAEQMMKNEQLVQDQILTHSNAYIERYDIKKEETRPNGLMEIQILAVVNRSALTKKLSEVMPAQTFQVGGSLQDLHAQSVTTQKRAEDAVALLQNVLKDSNPITQLMKVSLSPVKPQMRKAEIDRKEKELVYFRINVSVDQQKYFEKFLPPLLAVFDQVAVEKPKSVYLQTKPNNRGEKDYSKYLDGKYTEEYNSVGINIKMSEGCLVWRDERNGVPVGRVDLESPGYAVSADYVDHFFSHLDLNRSEAEKKGWFDALVITKMSANQGVVQAKHYRLPMECEAVLDKWQTRIIGEDFNDMNVGINKTGYNVIFADASGEEVFAASIAFHNDILRNFALGDSEGVFCGSIARGYGFYLTPMVSMNAKARERWVGFDIPRELLPDIQSVKIELAE